jgi:hypothetical protein
LDRGRGRRGDQDGSGTEYPVGKSQKEKESETRGVQDQSEFIRGTTCQEAKDRGRKYTLVDSDTTSA